MNINYEKTLKISFKKILREKIKLHMIYYD